MLIGRVVGELAATKKHPSHEDHKILLVQPLDLEGKPWGNSRVALDAVDAGVGDRVLIATEGYSAMSSVGRVLSPIDCSVIGVVDHVEILPGTAAPPRADH